MERAKLMRAGLGLKSLKFLECSDGELFHQNVLDTFPKLQEAGGYELLRTNERRPEDILIFFSGAEKVPPLGFNTQPVLAFLHGPQDTLPTASTCTLTLCLPTMHRQYPEFRNALIHALLGHGGFGQV